MNRLEERLSEASADVRQAAAYAVAPPLGSRRPRRPRTWAAVALAGAAVVVAAVAGLLAVSGPTDETVEVADTTPSPATSTPTQVTVPSTAPPASTPSTTPPASRPSTTPPTADPETATTVPSGGPSTDCSAAGAPVPGTQDGLPAAVSALRDQIAAAAVGCDMVALESLAGPDLVTSFGGGGPERFAEAESSGEPLLDILVGILDTPYAHQTFGDGSELYVWPSAFAYQTWQEIPPADLEALLGVYTQAELDQLSGFESYAGWRVGITPDGDWQFFVAGD